jgi:hypothetical protein
VVVFMFIPAQAPSVNAAINATSSILSFVMGVPG